MTTVGIIGASGMLGSMLVHVLSRNDEMQVVAVVRDREYQSAARTLHPRVQWEIGEADERAGTFHFDSLSSCQWIINAIGVTKPLIADRDAAQVQRAIWINSLLPYEIARIAATSGARVLQIATDCVYSGQRGKYHENDFHDALDVYGKTKSLGECVFPHVNHLRTSIIGPEVRNHRFLLEWFLRQPKGATLTGFRNHFWNGVTTLHFARICQGIVHSNLALPSCQHIVPSDCVTKAQLLMIFSKHFNRRDLRIDEKEQSSFVDRTLTTVSEGVNKILWDAAGYSEPPTIENMIEELARHVLRI